VIIKEAIRTQITTTSIKNRMIRQERGRLGGNVRKNKKD